MQPRINGAREYGFVGRPSQADVPVASGEESVCVRAALVCPRPDLARDKPTSARQGGSRRTAAKGRQRRILVKSANLRT